MGKPNPIRPLNDIPALSFRAHLQSELGHRCAANAQYSLRAFAQHLSVDHSTLSQVLRGKRALSSKAIESMGGKLKLPRSEIDRFVAYEQLVTARTGEFRELQQLACDTLCLISDASHYRIVELTRTNEFQPDSRWLARVLDLSVDEVNVVITRLLRLGLMEMEDRTRWRAYEIVPSSSFADFARHAVDNLAARLHGFGSDR